MTSEIVVFETPFGTVNFDSEHEMLSLTDVGKALNHRPRNWLVRQETIELIKQVAEDYNCLPEDLIDRSNPNHVWAHKELVWAYAAYVNPKFHLALIRLGIKYDRDKFVLNNEGLQEDSVSREKLISALSDLGIRTVNGMIEFASSVAIDQVKRAEILTRKYLAEWEKDHGVYQVSLKKFNEILNSHQKLEHQEILDFIDHIDKKRVLLNKEQKFLHLLQKIDPISDIAMLPEPSKQYLIAKIFSLRGELLAYKPDTSFQNTLNCYMKKLIDFAMGIS